MRHRTACLAILCLNLTGCSSVVSTWNPYYGLIRPIVTGEDQDEYARRMESGRSDGSMRSVSVSRNQKPKVSGI
jgi:hypothetical protein